MFAFCNFFCVFQVVVQLSQNGDVFLYFASLIECWVFVPSFKIVLVLSFLSFACLALDYLVCVFVMHFRIVLSCLCVSEFVFLCSVEFFVRILCFYAVLSFLFVFCVFCCI